MLKKTAKLFKNKFFFSIGIISLLFFWFFSSLFLNNYSSFSVLRYSHPYASKTEKLFKNERIVGEFIAAENYLGIVYLQLENFTKTNYLMEDVLIFKIKEKDSNNWYYENSYRIQSAKNSLFFPFGFPIILESKGKVYEFEIISTYGAENNSIRPSKNKNALHTAYKFPKGEILGSVDKAFSFFIKKGINSFTNFDFLLNSVFFLLPLVTFLIIRIIIIDGKKTNKKITKTVVFFLIATDLVIIKSFYLGFSSAIIIIWLFLVYKYRISRLFNLKLSFSILLLWTIYTLLNIDVNILKLNFFGFFFLTLVIAQSLFSDRKYLKK